MTYCVQKNDLMNSNLPPRAMASNHCQEEHQVQRFRSNNNENLSGPESTD